MAVQRHDFMLTWPTLDGCLAVDRYYQLGGIEGDLRLQIQAEIIMMTYGGNSQSLSWSGLNLIC
jgi:hypothetical protein